MTHLLKFEDLWIEGRTPDDTWSPIVKGVNLELHRGEVLALIGESGAGKSTIGLAALGYARPGCRISGGRVLLDDIDVTKLIGEERRQFRGRRVAYVAQSALAAFNASLSIGNQVTEGLKVHGLLSEGDAWKRATELYRRLQLPNPEEIGYKYPHQLSGGQLQRLMAAMAMTCWPDVLVLDEPTTAIDVTTQLEVLAAFKDVIKQEDTASLYVTHDLSVVAQIADRVVVLYDGQVVEQGSTEQILHDPKEDYTKRLMAAVRPSPRVTAQCLPMVPTSDNNDMILKVRNIDAGYQGHNGSDPDKLVLRDVSIDIPAGQVVGIIGESGCGKSTLARVISGLLPPTSGTVQFRNKPLPTSLDQRSRAELQHMQIIFQMPDVSFNPKKTVGTALERPLEFYFSMSAPERRARVHELLHMVELPPSYADRYPSELSGGEKQRVNLARALAAVPDVVLCDEITSALDTIVGANVIELLKHLKESLGNTYVFISHDLSTVASFADRIVVLYAGRVVEQGPIRQVLSPPFHPYTRLLIESVPELRQGWLEEVRGTAESITALSGDLELTDVGCSFANRCALAINGVCDQETPPSHELPGGHSIVCHHDAQDLESTLRRPTEDARVR